MASCTGSPHPSATHGSLLISTVFSTVTIGHLRPKCQCLGSDKDFLKARLKHTLAWRIGLAAYLLVLAVVGFWPTPVDKPVAGTIGSVLGFLHHHGVPEWFGYHFLEMTANIGLFVPFGILVAMAIPEKGWWYAGGLGALTSLSVEAGQLIFITARFSSPIDLVTNSLGAVIGVAIVRLPAQRNSSQPPEPEPADSTEAIR
ncbi:VanZ family protein [Paenarthrobacter nicotinovorans]|uniref:VanZ family protein n=1 Tax=Paenarthrobacter nicotinovorans TaxID=29320 RepID=UPI0009EDD7AA|nr:VanZ family protein [Paenarthrobacter nicotinovorans]